MGFVEEVTKYINGLKEHISLAFILTVRSIHRLASTAGADIVNILCDITFTLELPISALEMRYMG